MPTGSRRPSTAASPRSRTASSADSFLPDWLPTPGNRRYMAAVRDFDDIAAAVLAKRQTPFEPGPDLLSALLQTRDERGQPIDRRLLRDQIVTLLLAGHETTALALTWTLYLLSRHPEASAQVEEEVDAVLGHQPRPGAVHLDRLRYVGWAISEAMRLYPPVFLIGRESVRDVEIGGRRLVTGTICLVSQWVVHRDRRFWRDPELVQAGTVGLGRRSAAAPVRLLPVRRRPPHLHRSELRDDRGDLGCCDDPSSLSARRTAGCAFGRSVSVDHAAAGRPGAARRPAAPVLISHGAGPGVLRTAPACAGTSTRRSLGDCARLRPLPSGSGAATRQARPTSDPEPPRLHGGAGAERLDAPLERNDAARWFIMAA